MTASGRIPLAHDQRLAVRGKRRGAARRLPGTNRRFVAKLVACGEWCPSF